MSPGEVLQLAAELERAGVWLRYNPGEDKLYHSPASRVSTKLAEKIRAHRATLVEMMLEDQELRRTGTLQSERQVFEEFREAGTGRQRGSAA